MIQSYRCNSPTGSGEAKVESCVLLHMTHLITLLNTCPLNMEETLFN